MLSLRGVPLSVAENFSRQDVESPAYAASQRAFDALRGPGTPLLPERVVAEVRGPAPYVRVVLKNMLSKWGILSVQMQFGMKVDQAARPARS